MALRRPVQCCIQLLAFDQQIQVAPTPPQCADAWQPTIGAAMRAVMKSEATSFRAMISVPPVIRSRCTFAPTGLRAGLARARVLYCGAARVGRCACVVCSRESACSPTFVPKEARSFRNREAQARKTPSSGPATLECPDCCGGWELDPPVMATDRMGQFPGSCSCSGFRAARGLSCPRRHTDQANQVACRAPDRAWQRSS